MHRNRFILRSPQTREWMPTFVRKWPGTFEATCKQAVSFLPRISGLRAPALSAEGLKCIIS
jgi:hypothetical protein